MKNEDLDLSYRHSALHDHPDWLVLRAGYTLYARRSGGAKGPHKRVPGAAHERLSQQT